ncbi:MAG: valine--tRNA ligase [Candidatus Omnitrophota bacterium]
MRQIPSVYNPKESESKWYTFWEKMNFFHASTDSLKKPYVITIPPPNITGILHMGHALNNTVQDILIRWKRMQGCCAEWLPGTDHAGIATQNVVERMLAKEGLRRQDLGREKFLERVWKWREEYGSTIISQLKRLGCSCDWQRTRFTMDEGLSNAVIEVFIRLYEKGLIYRGNYIINWCPRCQTALSDEEAQHRNINGFLYYIKYPLKRSIVHSPQTTDKEKTADSGQRTADYIVVATTRPETMLGDVAVAVNPNDKRHENLLGATLILPLINREIKVIADEAVDPEFGTGAVKVTPAHDPNDFDMGLRHKLEPILVMNPDGTMNKNAGDYSGMDRFEAREAILEDLKDLRLLEKIEPHAHSVGHCYRCHTVVEPYMSLQWFVRMKPMAAAGIEAVKSGKIKFYPERWTKVCLDWMENIRDWCISRQIWWGHRLPVYYCKNCLSGQRTADGNQRTADSGQRTAGSGQGSVNSEQRIAGSVQEKLNADRRTLNAERYMLNAERGVIVSRVKPEKCSDCGSTEIEQDPDVLDTWFSSWLWPFSTFGWPDKKQTPDCQRTADSGQEKLNAECQTLNADLDYFYPTSTLVTAQEIIFFWVARMIMAGYEFMGEAPFKDVYIHGTVRDETGAKMSKSLGNIIDPVEIIDEYGTDALRFSLISITASGQDVFLSKEKFELGRNFANKIWNASRFILLNLDENTLSPFLTPPYLTERREDGQRDELTLVDEWIRSRLNRAIDSVTTSLENYRFNEAANTIYEFFWHEFCDWYVELVKPEMTKDEFKGTDRRKLVQSILIHCLDHSLRLLHPFMPFVTEEIWQSLPHKGESLMVAEWPKPKEFLFDAAAEEKFSLAIGITSAIRNIRAEVNIPPQRLCRAVISAAQDRSIAALNICKDYIKFLSKLESLEIGKDIPRPKNSSIAVFGDYQIYVLLEGLVDIDLEMNKLATQKAGLGVRINSIRSKLDNKNFMSRAPKDIVEKEQAKLKEAVNALHKIDQLMKNFREDEKN